MERERESLREIICQALLQCAKTKCPQHEQLYMICGCDANHVSPWCIYGMSQLSHGVHHGAGVHKHDAKRFVSCEQISLFTF